MGKAARTKTHLLIDGLNLQHGGGVIVMERLALAFAEAGYQVTVLLSRAVSLQSRIEDTVTIHKVGEAKGAFGALAFRHFKLDSLAEEIGANFLFSFNYFTPSLLRQVTYHVNVIPFLPWRERRKAVGFVKAIVHSHYARRALKTSDRNLFESKYLYELAATTGVSIRNPDVAYIGIDFPNDVPELADHSHVNYLVAITSGASHKRNDLLIEAFRCYRQQNPDAELRILGHADRIRASLTLRNREFATSASGVEFLGYLGRDAVYETLVGARALVTFSELESFYMVALEAMGVGCPVVAPDISSIRESVGEAGLLFPPGDVAVAVQYLCALSDKEHWAAMSKAAREWALQFEARRCSSDVVRKALC